MSIQKEKSSQQEIAEIWKLFRETRNQMKETDRRMQETDRRIKELDYMFTGHWGKLMEALTAGGLKSALKERNIPVTGISQNVEKIYNDERREFDLIATNGEELVVVEVKTTLKLGQVRYFLEKIKVFKNYFPEYKDKKVYGAVAYLKSNEGASGHAEKKGLFILNPVGSIIKVVNSPRFRPKLMA